MKLRTRRRWRRTPFLITMTLPVLGVGLLCLVEGRARAQAAQTQPPQTGTLRIGEFVVTGNKTLSQAAIIALSRHQVGDPCTGDVLNEIKANLTQTGDFGMHSSDPEDWVKVHAEEHNPPDGRCRVVIEVDENETIKNVQITGSGPIKTDEIRKLLHVSEGKTVFNPAQLRRDNEDIQKLYNSKGYAATFSADEGVDAQGNLNIPIIVARVGEIKLVKLRKTHRNVVLRTLKTKVGDYYNRETWSRDVGRVINLDLFEDVIPQEELDPNAPGLVRLTLSLPEKRTGSISAGIGYSNRQQLIGRAEITETNFRGMGQTVNLLWETGGAANRSSIELGFTEPWLDKHQTALSVQIYDKTVYRFANSLTNGAIIGGTAVGTDTRYNEQRVGGTITVSRPIKDTYRLALTGRAENVRTDPLDLAGFNAAIIQNGPIYSGGVTLLHDTRDLILDPVKGGYQSVSFQAGLATLKPPATTNGTPVSGVFGTVHFGKLALEGRQFYSLAGPRKKLDQEKSSLALRLLLGASVGTLPFFEQYFVGGAETLRGYREDRFWGKYMLLGSAEIRQPLARGLKGVLFTDVGNAWGGPYRNVNISGFQQGGFNLHVGVGLGIRVRTPLGPIRLDYGIGSEGGRTHFSIGNVF
jgi:outer membrane protein insertion porin family